MPTTQAEHTVNATEAGEILGLTAQAVINRVKDGKLPGEKDGHAWRIPLAAVYRQVGVEECAEQVGPILCERYDALREDAGQALADQLAHTFAAWEDYRDADDSPSGDAWGEFREAVEQLRTVLESFMALEDERSRDAHRLALRQALRRIEHGVHRDSDQGDESE